MNFRFFIFFVALLSLISCRKDEPDYEKRNSYFKNIVPPITSDSTINCTTYNIHLGFKAYDDPWSEEAIGGSFDQINQLVEILQKIDADIIALQEVPVNRSNTIVKNFLEILAARLQMNYAFGAHGYNDAVYPVEGEWGNAILTKFKINSIHNEEVEYIDKWARRSVLNAQLQLNDTTTLNALSLHHMPTLEGIPNTADYIEQLNGPVVMMGDFNYLGEINDFELIGYSDVDSTYLKHGIDRIFYQKEYFEVLEIGHEDDVNFTSDHRAQYGILKILPD